MTQPWAQIIEAQKTHGRIGIVVVDHGSRRQESNDALEQVVAAFQNRFPDLVICPAHMELASPSMSDAFKACVAKGAEFVCVFPYFLFPGRHWAEDIPNLAATASKENGDVPWVVTAPFGKHDLLIDAMVDRIGTCLNKHGSAEKACSFCQEDDHCKSSISGRS